MSSNRIFPSFFFLIFDVFRMFCLHRIYTFHIFVIQEKDWYMPHGLFPNFLYSFSIYCKCIFLNSINFVSTKKKKIRYIFYFTNFNQTFKVNKKTIPPKKKPTNNQQKKKPKKNPKPKKQRTSSSDFRSYYILWNNWTKLSWYRICSTHWKCHRELYFTLMSLTLAVMFMGDLHEHPHPPIQSRYLITM